MFYILGVVLVVLCFDDLVKMRVFFLVMSFVSVFLKFDIGLEIGENVVVVIDISEYIGFVSIFFYFLGEGELRYVFENLVKFVGIVYLYCGDLV